MRRFVIGRRHGHDYIRSLNDEFTLIVIPPEKQPESYAPGCQVVGTSFESSLSYDFEGVNIMYHGEDREFCNRELWCEAIKHYCQKVLQKVPAAYTPYSYGRQIEVKI